jgi:hypothetical protein
LYTVAAEGRPISSPTPWPRDRRASILVLDLLENADEYRTI